MVKLLKAIVYVAILLFGLIPQQFAFSQTIFPTVQSQCTPKDIDVNDNGLIEICDLEGLNAIRYQLDGSGYKENATAAKITTGCAADGCKGYELTRDLDFNDAASYRSISNKVVWTQGAGWLPIGSSSDAFSGRFEANGYIISNLYINSKIDNIALFAKTAGKAKINGLSLENINITGRFWVGGLVGSNEGIIINSNIEKGRLIGVGNYVGGLVGTNAGPIINSYADVRISGENFVGGLVGSNSSKVFVNNYAIGTIEAKQGVGGLVGVNNGLITAVHSTVKTIASLADVGGLVGINNGGEIRNSYATGDVIGGDSNVGGLVGINSGGEIRNSYATGDVIGEDSNVGGLVGTNSDSEVRNSYATGDVIGEDINVGGLVGISVDNSRITNSYAIGSVSGYANKGGLVGLNHSDSKVVYSYWDISTSLIRQSGGGIPKITAQLQSPTEPGTTATEIYYQWSQDDWDFGSANQYPLVKYVSDDDSLACSSSAPPNCNDLLSGQYARLSALLLSDGLTLSPSFNPAVSNYEVVVDRQLSEVTLMPFLVDDNAEVSVVGGRAFNKNIASGVAVSIPLNPPPQETLIKIGRQYRINIVYRLSAPTINLTPPSDNNRVNEGDTITLDASPNNNQADDLFSYQWTQLSNKDLLSEAVTNRAILEIEIPSDFVDANADDAEVVLQVEVSRATKRVSRQIALTIVKSNNDIVSASLPAPILTEATLTLSSPEVDRLIVQDMDGGGDASNVIYQWQYQLLDSTVWVDIKNANDKNYSVPLDLNLADYTLYRVRVDYRDGQNYLQQIVSSAYTFIKDIDKNDDGLIDINYLEDLDAIRYQLDGSGYRKGESFAKLIAGCPISKCKGYELTRDLDFQDDKSYRDATANKARWTSGEGWQPIGSLAMKSGDCSASDDECFNGILEGNGYTISNLTINRPSADSVGLFAVTDSAEIRNISLINADIVGKNHVGGLVGKSNRSKNTSAEGQIVNSYVAAKVIGISNVGGLIGWNNNTRIDNSYVVGDVYGNSDVGALIGQNSSATIERSYAEGVVVANANNAGGLVGNNIDGDINNSYAVSNVGGDNNVGGLVGRNRGRIVNCYAAGNVAGNTNEGGLVGSNRGVIENSYWDIPASGISANSGGEGRTSEQLKLATAPDTANPATYTGWSTKYWDFGSDEQYPTLKATSGDLLLSALRHGLKHLALSDHAIWSPPFKPSLQHYVGTVINDSEKIQLTPITLESTAHIYIYYGDGRLIDERIASGTTSSTIILNRENTTEIVIKITATNTILYKLKVRYEHVDIDSDDDGFIDINNLAQLNAIRYQLDGSGYRESETAAKVTTGCPITEGNEVCVGYQLKSDLDFSDAIENEAIANWQPIGTANNPFTGLFKGDGHKISNLIIDRPTMDAVGLFGVVDGTIDQVALEHVDIRGGNSVGSLAGINRGEIRNSFISGRITGSGESRNIGGLVGYNASTATIVNSFSSAYVEDSLYIGGLVGFNDGNIAACYATGSVGTGDYAGGLVGRNMGAIENSYASGNVEGRNYVGGFVAWNDSGTIANSYAVGEVDGSGTLGGFAARNTSTADNLGTITYSYWDKQTTMQDNSSGGLGFNTATLKSFASQNMDMSVIYYGWDLNVWQFGENVYPTLKYIKGSESIADSPPACSDSSSTLSVLPRCNTVLSGQSLGLADLRLDSPSAVSLMPAFRRPVLYYRMTVYADTRSIRLTPITYSTATLTINADSSSDEIALGDSIPLNDVGETLVTIDVESEGDRSVEYQIIVDRFSYLKQTDDIDADDDGLIEIRFIEALDAIRYQLDGSGYKEAATHIKIAEGCDEDGSGKCIGYELVKDLDFNNDADYRDALLNRVMLSAAAGWQAIGSNAQPFVAEFNGNGHTISNLRINNPAAAAAGLFGVIENTRIESVGLLNVDVTGGLVGALVGSSKNSEIVNSYATGRVRGETVGGLVGSNAGTIINSYTDVQVYLARSGFFAGGLVGIHYGTILGSYAAGEVNGFTFTRTTPEIGGLVGYMFSVSRDRMPTIVDSYASGNVSGSRAGGLVGNLVSGAIINSYSSGKVSANTSGGLIGSASPRVSLRTVNRSNGEIKSSYWDEDVNGIGLSCLSIIEGRLIISDRCDEFPVAQPKNTVVLQSTTATGIYEEWSDDSWNFGTDKQYPALKHIKDSDSRATCRDREDTPTHLPVCGTLLSGQRVGLSKLELVLDDLSGLDKAPLSPAFRSSLFDYSLKTYRNVQEIQLIPSAYDDNATIRIVVDGVVRSTVASGNTSGRIPLKQSGDTHITIDVETQREESFQYRIVVSYYGISAVPDDIDADNDGLIELYFLEDVNAIRYNQDGRAFRLTSDSESTRAGCPYRDCKGYELVRNLDFNNDADYRDVANKLKWTTGSGWSPVTIRGAFNGNGHTISNLMINRPTSNAVGLFGVITDAASIDHIGLLGVDIIGQTEVGGLAGRNQGVVANSYAIGKVTGKDATVGGLVGYSSGEIVNSYASVETIGMDNVGGLVGNMATGKITNCYALGDIEGNKQVGGLVGQITQGVVKHNYAIGKVVAKMNYGGFAGSGSDSDNYWDVETSMVGTANSDGAGGAKGFTTETLQSPTAPTTKVYVNWDTDAWHFGTSKQYPLLKHKGDSDKSKALLSGQYIGLIDLWWDPAAVALSADFDRDIFDYRLVVYADIPSIRLMPTAHDPLSNIRISNGIGFSQLVESATTSSAIPLNTVAPTIITIEVETADDLTVSYRLNVEHLNYLNFADGFDIDSDDDGLIEIRTVGQLNAVRYQLDGRGYKEHESVAIITAGCAETGDGICRGYELTEDLDFDDNPNFGNWQAIGTNSEPFAAVFKGNGHTISNLTIDRPQTDYAALFGATGKAAKIDSVGMVNVDIVGRSRVGGLVGFNAGGIVNSYVTGSVEGRGDYVGGLIGDMLIDSDSEEIILHGYTNVQVTGKRHVGGFVGRHRGGKIIGSYAVGNVVGNADVGGFIGSGINMEVENSYASGDATGDSGVGGFVGSTILATSSTKIVNSYAIGNVIAGADFGGFIGVGNIDDNGFNYWNTDIVSGNNNLYRYQGFSTEILRASSAQSNDKSMAYYGWDEQSWHFGTDMQYPVLIYTKGPNNDGCRDESENTRVSELPVCNSILFQQRNGLADLKLNIVGLTFLPDFQNAVRDYSLTVYQNTKNIQLTPIAYNSGAIITISSNRNFNQIVADGNMSNEITLYRRRATTITIIVQTPDDEPSRYHITVNRFTSDSSDIDADNDGFIDIKTVEELNAMRYQLDGSGYRESEMSSKITLGCPAGKCRGYELVADLDFNDAKSYMRETNQSLFTSGAAWLPIGNSTKPFAGTFKGNGRVISNLIINRPDAEGVGLFGEISAEAQVDSVGLFNIDIVGKSAVGGLVGVNRGTISKSYTSGKVKAEIGTSGMGGDRVGGLVGENRASDAGGLITDSYANTQVTGKDKVGGLVGDSSGQAIIIRNSYATGAVSGSKNVGGLVGSNDNGIVENSYWNLETSRTKESAGGVSVGNLRLRGLSTTSQTKEGGIYYGWSPEIWDFGGMLEYPALKDENNKLFIGQRVGFSFLNAVRPSESSISIIDELLPLNPFDYRHTVAADVSDIELEVILNPGNSIIDISVETTTTNFRGNGSRSDSIALKDKGVTLITISQQTTDNIVTKHRVRIVRNVDSDTDGLIEIGTAAQFNAMRYQLDGSGFAESAEATRVTTGCRGGQCNGYELIDNIDLAGIDFEPIGTADEPFTATFDGNGYTISNLRINREEADDVALFTRTAGRINGVGLINANIKGHSKVGALAAMNEGTISNSYAVGTIEGKRVVGGLVGDNENTIINSYVSGRVRGHSIVGGLAGLSMSRASINNSFTLNDVSGYDRVGGLVGLNTGIVADSYASGSVQGSRVIGGLIGENSEGSVSTSYATASVFGTRFVGGLIGKDFFGVFNYSYWDIQTNRLSYSAGGVGMPTVRLQSPTTATEIYEHWSVANWDFGTMQSYPILKYARGSDANNPACGRGDELTDCGTTQSYSLKSLSIVEAAILAPSFGFTKLNYKVEVDTTTEHIHLVPTAWESGTDIYVASDNGFKQRVPSSTTSSAISLKPLDTTVITIDVAGDRAVQYRLEVTRLPLIDVDNDIDDDDDGYIEIHTLEDLNAIRYQLDGSGYRRAEMRQKITTGCAIGGCRGYELVANLDFKNNESYTDIANKDIWTTRRGWEPIGDCNEAFSGSFKGNGYQVSNLTINRPNSRYIALFGCIGADAEIEDIGLLNVNIIGRNRVGSLVAVNKGEVKDSYAIGIVKGYENVGGLFGINEGSVSASYTRVEVNGNSENVGGLVGVNDGKIANCYATGNVIGKIRVGSLVGYNRKSIVHSYAVGELSIAESETNSANYLVGFNKNGAVRYSYWDAGDDPDSSISKTKGIGLATNTLKAAQRPGATRNDAYYQWNDSVWDFGTANQYPTLKYADGTLLSMQRNGLIGLVLSNGARLLPAFETFILNYDVLVAAGITELQFTPTPNSADAAMNIYKDGQPVQTLQSAMPVNLMLNNKRATEITIVVRQAEHKQAVKYKLVVRHLVDMVIDGIPAGAVDEGNRIRLDSTYRVGTIDYSYRWQQLSEHFLPPKLDTDQATLEFKVAEDWVAEDVADREIRLRLEVGAYGETLLAKELRITINKINNDSMPSPLASPTMHLSELTAPQIDLSQDADGEIKTIVYQWQLQPPDEDTNWHDIEGASEDTYTVPLSTVEGSRFRVLISYIDGQGYIEQDIKSEAYVYVDIDDDDDGLIEIHTLEDLNAMRYQLDGSGYKEDGDGVKITTGCPSSDCKGYELTRNLDFKDDESYRDAPANKHVWTMASGWPPIDHFNAIFKGNGYAVSNLYINRNEGNNVGLFHNITRQAKIDGIGLLDLSIDNRGNTGGLVGINRGTITNSYVRGGSLKGSKKVGGLVGNNLGTINNSYTALDVGGYCMVGGLVGHNAANGKIVNSYAVGDVAADINSRTCVNYIGGLVGDATGAIENSYAVGAVSANGDDDVLGGLVARHDNIKKIDDSYWDGTVNADTNNSYGTSKTTAELQTPTMATGIYENWSDEDWDFGAAEQYPALKYECSEDAECGVVLPYQGSSSLLAQLILSAGLSLLPTFDPNVFRYRVQVEDFNAPIAFTPYVANINTKIKVTKNAETVNEQLSSGETVSVSINTFTKTTIVLETIGVAAARGVRYTLHINIPPMITIADEQRHRSADEGDDIILSVAVDDINKADTLRYNWMQLSGPPLLSSPQTNTDLVITLPHDLIDRDEQSSSASFVLEVSDGLMSDSIRMSVKISKVDNDVIAALAGMPTWLDAYRVAAAEIDLSDDSDGTGDNRDITYQWQEMSDGNWQDIVGATKQSYRLATDTTNGGQYRVTVSYTDGQGYSAYLNSSPTAFILDVDRDDDGLIEISDLEGLNAMRYALTGNGYREDESTTATTTGCPVTDGTMKCKGYELTRDLDFADATSYRSAPMNRAVWTTGAGWKPIGIFERRDSPANEFFAAIFDGNGHTISNLYINRNAAGGGLFGATSNAAEIRDIALLNVDIISIYHVGGLVGYDAGSSIVNSYVLGGRISKTDSNLPFFGQYFGGLIGYKIGGTISNSYVADISQVSGRQFIGGLVGDNTGGTITDSYASIIGEVSGEQHIGGLVGNDVGGMIMNSYAISAVGGLANVGGLVGSITADSRIIRSYWDTTVSGIIGGMNGEGLPTAQLQLPVAPGTTMTDVYYDWHESDWDFGNQRQYPAIKYLCRDPPQRPNCGRLLPSQRTGLFDILLGKGAVLSPVFDYKRHKYSVTIDSDTTQLKLTPIANDPSAVVIINDRFKVASGNFSPSLILQKNTNTVITLRVTADRNYNERPYELTVNNRFAEVTIDGIPQGAVDEGTTVNLDVSVDDDDGDVLRYRWSDLSGLGILSGVNTLFGVIQDQDDADISFRIADDLLAATQDSIDITLLLTVDDGIASVAKKVPLTINKHNSFISGSFRTTLRGLTYTAPDIDLNLDADGVHPNPRLRYQWQQLIGGQELDITGATDKTYIVGDFINPYHRVLISYMDGQAHEHTIESLPRSFAALSASDNNAGLTSLSIVAGEQTQTIELEADKREYTINIDATNISQITVIAEAETPVGIGVNNEAIVNGSFRNTHLDDDGKTIITVKVDGDPRLYIITVESPTKTHVYLRVFPEGLLLR